MHHASATMRPSFLRLRASSVIFFTRPRCGLCSEAKHVLEKVSKTIPFAIKEVDITEKSNQEWYDKYAFDVPVMHFQNDGKTEVVMHRISEEQAANLLKQNNT